MACFLAVARRAQLRIVPKKPCPGANISLWKALTDVVAHLVFFTGRFFITVKNKPARLAVIQIGITLPTRRQYLAPPDNIRNTGQMV